MLIQQEVEQHVHPAGPVILADLAPIDVRFPQEHEVPSAPGNELAELVEVVEIGTRVEAPRPRRLQPEGDRVDAEPRGPQLHPERHDLLQPLPHRRVLDVQVGLEVEEAVEVVLASFSVVGPCRLLDTRKRDPFLRIRRLAFRPHVEIAISGVALPSELEPGVLIGRVVGDEVDDDPDPAVGCLMD